MKSSLDETKLPKFGLFLLNTVLTNEFGQNEVGDLEEEFRERLRRETSNVVRRWFWGQLFRTIGISLLSFQTAVALFRRITPATHWPLMRRPSLNHSAISIAFIGLVTFFAVRPSNPEIGLLPPRGTAENIERSGVAQTYSATAYSLRGRTASGKYVTRGLIAADPRHLPLGTRVRLDAGPWSGEYLVADTGGAARKPFSDIWRPATRGRYNSAVEP